MNNWQTSVNELLSIFRGALLSIIPWVEKAKIKWKNDESYDDWDNISESLYNNIVCSSLVGEVLEEYNIAKYNYHYQDYSSIDFLQVKDSSPRKLAFVSFYSASLPLDSVTVALLNENEVVKEYINIEFKNITFAFAKNANGERTLINNIEICI